MTQAAADAAIVAANLTVGNITMAADPVVPAGSVISQNPVACVDCAMAGDPVDLVVSTGQPILSDVNLAWLRLVTLLETNDRTLIMYTITNAASAQASATGTATLTGTDGSSFTTNFTNLAPGSSQTAVVRWRTPRTPQTVTLTVTATVSGVDVDTLIGTVVVQ
jgi:hypothetical protein